MQKIFKNSHLISHSIWILILVIAMAFWASGYPFIKLIGDTIDPFLLSFLRFFTAGLVVVPISIFLKDRSFLPEKKDIIPFILLSILLVAPTPLLIWGISLSSTVNSAIIMNSNPLMIAILAPFFIREKTNHYLLVGIFIGIIGVAVTVLNGKSPDQLFQDTYFLGSLIILLAALIVSLFTIYSQKYVKKYGTLVLSSSNFICGSTILGLISIFQGSFFSITEVPTISLIYASLIGVLGTAVSHLLWYSSLKHLQTSVAASFKLLIPIFATLYSYLFLDEEITIYMIYGMILTCAGISIVQKFRQRR